jgi:sec-independent protein translocase protein TatC
MTADAPASEEGRMTLFEHISELRRRLFISIGAILVGAIICWFFYFDILDFLIAPYCDLIESGEVSGLRGELGECNLYVTDPLEPFRVRLQVAGYGGIALAIPVILWQFWRFIVPALYAHERRYAAMFVSGGTMLFFLGAALAYWSIPRALGFLQTIGGEDLTSIFAPAAYMGFVVKMMVAFGLGFEFPIVLIFLQLAGLLHHTTLRKYRHYAIVGIVVLVAVITPSGDPITLVVLSVPLYVFYEMSILFGRLRDRQIRKRARVEEAPA